MFKDLSLKLKDPLMFQLLNKEIIRQKQSINLIASENYLGQAAQTILGSCVQNKYAEGYPGKRYYNGCSIIDEIETECQQRLLKAFDIDNTDWQVNVQPYSGSPANLAAYTSVLNPGDKMLGLDLFHGGHLTHGFYSVKNGNKNHVSKTSLFFQSKLYKVNQEGYIDYDELQTLANEFKPKLIIAGYSAYSRDLDYQRYRQICDKVNALLYVDMSHFSGLVAGKVLRSPFKYADVVVSTTHKSLKGPRSGIIFSKNELMTQINNTVFPGLQGGPHINQIAALSVSLQDVLSEQWPEYCKQIILNSKQIAQSLIKKDYEIQTNGTDNHMCIFNVSKKGMSANKMDYLLDKININVNKNTMVHDKSAINPSGLRVGSCAITSRGYQEKDAKQVVEFIDSAVKLGLEIQTKSGVKISNFKQEVDNNPNVLELQKEVIDFSEQFEMPGNQI